MQTSLKKEGGRLTRRKVYKTFGSLRSSQLRLAPLRARANFNSLGPTIEIFPRMPGPNISRACGGIAQLGERRQRRTPAGSVGRLVRYRCRSTLIAAVWLTWKVTRALLPRADRRSKVGIRLRMCLCFEVT